MNKKKKKRIFPEKLSVNDILNLVEEKVREWDCSLEEAFDRMIQEKLQDRN